MAAGVVPIPKCNGSSLLRGRLIPAIGRRHGNFDVSEGVRFRRPPTGPFFAFSDFLAITLGRICVRGPRSLVNALKIMTDVAFSTKYHLFSATLPTLIAKISFLFKRFAWKTAKKCNLFQQLNLWPSKLFKSANRLHFWPTFRSVKCRPIPPKYVLFYPSQY